MARCRKYTHYNAIGLQFVKDGCDWQRELDAELTASCGGVSRGQNNDVRLCGAALSSRFGEVVKQEQLEISREQTRLGAQLSHRGLGENLETHIL